MYENGSETNHRLWEWLRVFFGRRTGYVIFKEKKERIIYVTLKQDAFDHCTEAKKHQQIS